MVIQPKYARTGTFRDGVCPVTVKDAHDWIFIDKSGRQAVPGTYYSAMSFSEGRAFVNRGIECETYRYDLIDKNGKIFPLPDGAEVQTYGGPNFSEGLAIMMLKKDKSHLGLARGDYAPDMDHICFIDREGKIVITLERAYPSQFADRFRGGLARVNGQGKSPREGYIDRTGKFVWVDRD